jgi:uncharacterized protein (DUF736 family)
MAEQALEESEEVMAFDREMTGILFRNDKGDNPKRPDYRGTLTMGGTEYVLAGWIKQGQKGKFLSLKVSEGDDRQPRAGEKDDEDCPF